MPQKELTAFVLGILLTIAVAAVVSLFYKADSSQVWDILKLAIQGLGALVIARLTVYWAVDTFKSQKTWERDAATFSSVLSALREMKRCLEILYDDEIHARNYIPEYISKVELRHNEARKVFEGASSLSVLLTPEISSIVLQLEEDLANGNYEARHEWLDNELFLVSNALKAIEAKKGLIR